MAEKTQSASSHAKLVLGFHGVTFILLACYAVWALTAAVKNPTTGTFIPAALGLGLVGLFYYVRTFANGNQDRIIRLEERLRMRELLPADMHGRVNDFTTPQLIALRFASDGELPALAKRVLDEGITDRKAIKELVQEWRPDHDRV
jgi:hypothetical protein